jgi:hypothetical protein
MNNPSIELAWGGGRWPKRQKKVVEPTMQTAIDFSRLAIEEIGFEYAQPKRINIWRCGRSEECWGSSDGPTDIDVHIRVDHIKHRKVARFLFDLTLSLGHELVHAIRSEFSDEPSLIEHIASEGLAHVAEDTLSHIVLGSENAFQQANMVAQYSSTTEYSAMRKAMFDQRNYRWPRDGQDDEVRSEWLDITSDSPPPGIIVGITEVQRRLAEGSTIVELMTRPAEEILDLNAGIYQPADRLLL